MIDIGLDDPDLATHFRLALDIIDQPIAHLTRLAHVTPLHGTNNEIERLHHALPPGPISLPQALITALESGTGALQHISLLAQNPIPAPPIVFQAPLRSALVGAARVIHVLLPTNPATRLDHAAAILGQDAGSGARALTHYTQFSNGLAAVRAPQRLLNDFTQQRADLRQQHPATHDGQLVDDMIESLIQALHLAHATDPDTIATIDTDGETAMADEAHWLWNTYSGLAHTYSWPRILWSTSNDPRVPGDYAMDLQLVATCTQIALTAHLDRAAPGSANTATPVNLTTPPKPPTTT